MAIRETVMDATRHILATTLTTMGGFAPLLIDGDPFWLPFASACGGRCGRLGHAGPDLCARRLCHAGPSEGRRRSDLARTGTGSVSDSVQADGQDCDP